ncbi:MAG: hypothetical protein LKG42_02665 [Eubacterium sp.]|jgi:hypothetical protein|nr:hypothetical protein [Eubacterium sp.]MCH4046013.1 hypothetical protein [Eubacterium sp.]MCH4079107.1 hypothetical protein [Eubacterium sp.]MCH4110766.1 hypothetical protein [Eubacterium sp.]MCI1306908.1 hypothetical protein [Eubacterium sp.]
MADCYMRVGTSATGAVDNIGAGGMFVKVDMKDGHYFVNQCEISHWKKIQLNFTASV